MNTFKSSPGVLLNCLRPFFEGPNFRDLKVQCRNGESLLTTRLLFSAFLHPSVLTELCQLDQILGDDAQACIILTDSNVNDVEELIAASIKNDDSNYIDIDAEFTDKFYWCDVVKLSTKNVELVSSNRREGVVKSGEKVTQHKSPRKRKKAAIEVTEVPVELVKQEQDDDDFLHDQYGDLHDETERDWLEDQGGEEDSFDNVTLSNENGEGLEMREDDQDQDDVDWNEETPDEEPKKKGANKNKEENLEDKPEKKKKRIAAKRKRAVSLTIQQKYDIITCLDNQTCSKQELSDKYKVTCNAISKMYNHQRNSVLFAMKSGGKFQACSRRLRNSKFDTVGSQLYSWYCRQNPQVISQNVLLTKAKAIVTTLSNCDEVDKINIGWIHRWKKTHGVYKCNPQTSSASTTESTSAVQQSSSLNIQNASRTESTALSKTCEILNHRKCNIALTLLQKYAIITALENQTSSQSELSKEYNVTCNTISKIYNHQRHSILCAIKSGEFQTDAKRLRKTKLDTVATRLLDWYWSANLTSVSDLTLLGKAQEIAQGLDIQEVSGVNKSWIGRWKKSHGISQSKANPNFKNCKS